ncbi:PREDICTED: uncharacterized protein LOC105981804 [Dipodomys ordii]|uniref:Large ribosomal subunit protein eL39 n=1 Tax=Dipodomys ordii TaxID=10020 RepID=A0A1S3ERM4_DIPOR|nr:PREDICTED: uncharacterized protein LOC105981804 [Dipodomys ordii]
MAAKPMDEPQFVFPVNVHGTAARPHQWCPHDPKVLERYRPLSGQTGCTPHAQQVLGTPSIALSCPRDWKSFMRPALSSGDFLLRKAAFYDECERHSAGNVAAGGGTMPTWGTLRELMRLPPHKQRGPCSTLTKHASVPCGLSPQSLLKKGTNNQKPTYNNEPFTDFIARVQEAVAREVSHAGAQDAQTKTLIWKGATRECRKAIAPERNGEITDWIHQRFGDTRSCHEYPCTGFPSTAASARAPPNGTAGTRPGGHIAIIDTKDCFSPIPLHPKDKEYFAFSRATSPGETQSSQTLFSFCSPWRLLCLPELLIVSSHKTFRIKRFLAKKQKQNRPIPQWIRMKTGNKIRSNSKRRTWRRIKMGL